VADFHPELGENLAERHVTGHDAVAERTRFILWLLHDYHDCGKPTNPTDNSKKRWRSI
jgi:hypothetical protein